MDVVTNATKPYVRVLIMLVALLVAMWISWYFTGSALPSKTEDALIFQNTLLLVVLGSAVLEVLTS